MSAYTFYLIRHGMTAGNEEKRYIGSTDEPLSEGGAAALLRRKEAGAYPPVKYVFSSPMLRARQTAALLYPEISPVIIEAFRESDFGRFEGKTFSELSGDAAYMAWVQSGGTLPFPDGEPEGAVRERVLRGLSRVCALLPRESAPEKSSDAAAKTVSKTASDATAKTVFETASDALPNGAPDAAPEAALILHGGVIMTLLAALLSGEIFVSDAGQRYLSAAERQMRFSFMVKNGGVLTLSVEKEGEKWFNCSVKGD